MNHSISLRFIVIASLVGALTNISTAHAYKWTSCVAPKAAAQGTYSWSDKSTPIVCLTSPRESDGIAWCVELDTNGPKQLDVQDTPNLAPSPGKGIVRPAFEIVHLPNRISAIVAPDGGSLTFVDDSKDTTIALPPVAKGGAATIRAFASGTNVYLVYESKKRAKLPAWDGTIVHVDASAMKVVGQYSLLCKGS